MGRVAGGDGGALEVLHARYGRILRVLVFRILRQEPEAEDVVQEVYLELWRRAGLYSPLKGRPLSWLVTLARRRAIDRLRRRRCLERVLDRVRGGGVVDPLAGPDGGGDVFLDGPGGNGVGESMEHSTEGSLAGVPVRSAGPRVRWTGGRTGVGGGAARWAGDWALNGGSGAAEGGWESDARGGRVGGWGGVVECQERRRILLEHMAGLPPVQREVLELAYFSGMSQREIASSRGVPLGTVKTRMELGRRKLGEALRDLRTELGLG